jgi:hypothetical protein
MVTFSRAHHTPAALIPARFEEGSVFEQEAGYGAAPRDSRYPQQPAGQEACGGAESGPRVHERSAGFNEPARHLGKAQNHAAES